MTIAISAGSWRYLGNGVTTIFAYTAKIFASTDLRVEVNDVLQTSGYTVSGVGSDAGGTVTFTPAPVSGAKIFLGIAPPPTQDLELTGLGAFNPQGVEDRFDKQVNLVKFLVEQIARATKIPRSSALVDVPFPDPAASAGLYLRVRNDGLGFEAATAGVVDLGSFTASGAGAVARTALSKLGDIVAVEDFGAKGDGSTDDTTAIQNAINAVTTGTKSGAVRFNFEKTYKITATLTYTGTAGTSLSLYADVKPGATPHGARILWAGGAAGTMLETKGGNALSFRNLAFDGGGIAKYALRFLYDTIGGTGSANGVVDNCWVGGVTGADSAAIYFGGSAFQVSEFKIVNCTLTGYSTPGTSYYGVLADGANNVKNFVVERCSISGFRYGLCHGLPTTGAGSGYFLSHRNSFALQTVADHYGASGNCLMISGGGSEGSPMLLTSHGSGGSALYPTLIEGFYWDSSAGANDEIIAPGKSAQLVVRSCSFFNRRTGSSVPRIRLDSTLLGTIRVEDSFFFQATVVPVFDESGNAVTDANYPRARVYASGNLGGASNTPLADLSPLTAGANYQALQIRQLTELVTVAAAGTTDTTILMPGACIVLGVPVRTTVVIPTATSYSVGDSGNATRFNTANVGVAANSTDPGTKAGAYFNAGALAIRLTMNGGTPANNSGRVRVTIYYILVTPPSS